MVVLFDLDGTLTDPYEGISASVLYAVDQMGLPTPDQAALRRFIGPPLQDSFEALGLSEADVVRAIAHYRERFSDRGLYENRVYDGVPGMLSELRRANWRLAVATSKPTTFAERILDHFGLAEYFEIVGGATLDGARRSKADIISWTLAALDADPAGALMVGDRSQDIVGAQAHGMTSVGVAWGYAEPGELEAAGATFVATHPGAVPPLVMRARVPSNSAGG